MTTLPRMYLSADYRRAVRRLQADAAHPMFEDREAREVLADHIANTMLEFAVDNIHFEVDKFLDEVAGKDHVLWANAGRAFRALLQQV